MNKRMKILFHQMWNSIHPFNYPLCWTQTDGSNFRHVDNWKVKNYKKQIQTGKLTHSKYNGENSSTAAITRLNHTDICTRISAKVPLNLCEDERLVWWSAHLGGQQLQAAAAALIVTNSNDSCCIDMHVTWYHVMWLPGVVVEHTLDMSLATRVSNDVCHSKCVVNNCWRECLSRTRSRDVFSTTLRSHSLTIARIYKLSFVDDNASFIICIVRRAHDEYLFT